MRVSAILALTLGSAALLGCDEYVCEDEAGSTACRYCAQDRLATGNPHAGMCRYCPGTTVCTGDSCTDELRCQSRVFVSVPGATFRTGPAPKSSGAATVPSVVQVTPTSQSLSMGATVQWSVHWDLSVAVTAVIVDAPQLGGYFELPVTEDQSNAGTVVVPMVESAEAPGESGCLGPTTCWTEAPPERTTADLSVAMVGAGGEVGQPMGGVGLTWSAPSFPHRTTTPDPGDGCPSSAAALGCCTTSGGIQKVGVWVAPGCKCPSGTCAGANNYCGCQACGGC